MNICFVRENDCAISENKQQQIEKMNGKKYLCSSLIGIFSQNHDSL